MYIKKEEKLTARCHLTVLVLVLPFLCRCRVVVYWWCGGDADEQGDALPTENQILLQVPRHMRTIRAF